MSYCHPKWVSDYTYQALCNDQLIHGMPLANIPTMESLLIRITFDPDGRPTLHPVYILSAVPTEKPTSSDYMVELLDATGKVVASHAVPVYVAAEQGIVAQAIYATLPRPAQTIARLRLVHGGKSVAERELGRQAPGLAATSEIEYTAGALTLRWGAPEVPALVRYTVDDGLSWTTVGLDVLGGELRLDPRTLPSGAGRFEITLADNRGRIVGP